MRVEFGYCGVNIRAARVQRFDIKIDFNIKTSRAWNISDQYMFGKMT